MLQLDDHAVNEVALVKVGQRAVDHLVHLLIRDVGEVDDGCVLDFGQNGPLSKPKIRGPFVMIDCYIHHVRLSEKRASLQPCNKHVSGANITCAHRFSYKLD